MGQGAGDVGKEKSKSPKLEIVVSRSLVFAGLVASIIVVIVLVTFVTSDLLIRLVLIPKWLSNVIAAVVIAALYEPIRSWLIEVTEPYLHQKAHEHKRSE